MTNGVPSTNGKRARLAAKRELLIEAVRAWANATAASGFDLSDVDLLEAWRDYARVEKGG